MTINREEAIKLGRPVWDKLPPYRGLDDEQEVEVQRLIGEAILAWANHVPPLREGPEAEVSKLKQELAQEQESHQESLRMYRNRRDAYEKLEEQNKELLEALQNMTGLFGEAVTRHVMGKAYGELHQEAVKTAKAVLVRYPQVES